MDNFFKEVGDFVSDTVDWVGDKLGDTVDWIREDPLEALAVAAIVYGGYAMYTSSAAAGGGTAAGAMGEASAAGEAASAASGASAGGATAATEAAAAETVGGGMLSGGEAAAGMTGGGMSTGASVLNPHQLALAESGGATAAGGASSGVAAGATITNPAYVAPEAFWSMDNPYAWMVGGQAVSSAGNAYAADQARQDAKDKYNAQSYYGTNNAGQDSGAAVSAGQGLLQVSNNFTQNRSPAPSMDLSKRRAGTYSTNNRRGVNA